jgi:thiol-disulfide isomerase/thioredoxin
MKIMRLMVALATLMAVPVLSLASPPQPFDAKAFDTLTASGKPVVIAVHASWCPTCKAQMPIQTELMQSPEFKEYTMFVVDFDKDTYVLKRFHVAKQSTMIVFRGKTEVGRSVGDTQRASLEALMRKAQNSIG